MKLDDANKVKELLEKVGEVGLTISGITNDGHVPDFIQDHLIRSLKALKKELLEEIEAI